MAFGMKLHIGVDEESGMVHSMETISANVHDLTPSEKLLHGEEMPVMVVLRSGRAPGSPCDVVHCHEAR